jgi:hypothetical protein
MKSKTTFKIEANMDIWHIIMSQGCYSSYDENHLFIRANDLEEAYYFLKEYAQDYGFGYSAWTGPELVRFCYKDLIEVVRGSILPDTDTFNAGYNNGDFNIKIEPLPVIFTRLKS